MVDDGFYLDISAIVKRHRHETGTRVVDGLLNSPMRDNRF